LLDCTLKTIVDNEAFTRTMGIERAGEPSDDYESIKIWFSIQILKKTANRTGDLFVNMQLPIEALLGIIRSLMF
jgi:hypothetical protein